MMGTGNLCGVSTWPHIRPAAPIVAHPSRVVGTCPLLLRGLNENHQATLRENTEMGMMTRGDALNGKRLLRLSLNQPQCMGLTGSVGGESHSVSAAHDVGSTPTRSTGALRHSSPALRAGGVTRLLINRQPAERLRPVDD